MEKLAGRGPQTFKPGEISYPGPRPGPAGGTAGKLLDAKLVPTFSVLK
ncbi:hypothetical protein SAMN03159463_03153 [Mesorhizobium sp. NFR06]|nr:hypothetical protein SAMN03159463_03153 [Mesorhizobium sp. NFR06]